MTWIDNLGLLFPCDFWLENVTSVERDSQYYSENLTLTRPSHTQNFMGREIHIVVCRDRFTESFKTHISQPSFQDRKAGALAMFMVAE